MESGVADKKEDIDEFLRHKFPSLFIEYLKSMGRLEELSELYNGTITPYNFTWYVFAELLPKLTRMREKGQLL